MTCGEGAAEEEWAMVKRNWQGSIIGQILDRMGEAEGCDGLESCAAKGYLGDLDEETMAALVEEHGTPADALYAIQVEAQRRVSAMAFDVGRAPVGVVIGMVTVGGVPMSASAADVARWAGVDPAEDVVRLRNGQITRAALAVECEDGADEPETISAWREYVSAVALAAEMP